MDGEYVADATLPAVEAESLMVEATSSEYLGRWNRLVSTTNWEKGRIICEWRSALIEAGAPAASSSDEAWSRRVGNITPQHSGRLRRVWQRFGALRESYPGLYWSHFQAALDWNDAEMWLEGALQSDWSISEMQGQRAQAIGALEATPGEETSAVEVDEDALPGDSDAASEAITGSMTDVQPASDSDDDLPAEFDATDGDFSSEPSDSFAEEAAPPVRPFENLAPLPADLRDAFEAFKLAIIHHRLSQWQEISCDEVLASLDALRQLILAPPES